MYPLTSIAAAFLAHINKHIRWDVEVWNETDLYYLSCIVCDLTHATNKHTDN